MSDLLIPQLDVHAHKKVVEQKFRGEHASHLLLLDDFLVPKNIMPPSINPYDRTSFDHSLSTSRQGAPQARPGDRWAQEASAVDGS